MLAVISWAAETDPLRLMTAEQLIDRLAAGCKCASTLHALPVETKLISYPEPD